MTMNDNLTPEQVIESLNRMKMTPEERQLADAEKAGKALGKIISSTIIFFLAPTIIWLALVYLVGVEIAWVKVFGIYFIFNFIKNIIVQSFKK
jgi:hypothetical protein